MRQRDREASALADDAHADAEPQLVPADHEDSLFGDSILGDYDTSEDDDGRLPKVSRVSRRDRDRDVSSTSRSARRSQARRRQRRRFVTILAVLVVALVAVATWLVVVPLYHYLNPSDYSGNGGASVTVAVQADDDATDIAKTLYKDGVVASERAFTNAASDNKASQNIQPGSYRLHKHMSAANAVKLLLNPSARVRSDVLVTEGATVFDVQQRLTAKPCTAKSPANALCGPGLSTASVAKVLRDPSQLGLPTDFSVDGKPASSPEGFLFPATYTVQGNAASALQQMISTFTARVRANDFAASARALHLTPYQELIIASIAEKEAKYAQDYAGVARVILNRLAAHKPLQIDATSAYGAKVKGLNPAKIIYSQIDSPYNTYTHDGLPPTPIANPGLLAMSGAAHPATGNALYYVNIDANGHLGFFADQNAFAKAAATCRAHNWGCG